MSLNSGEREIRIGIIGLGVMGKGLLYQSMITDGIKTVAVCDINVEKACKILREFHMDYIIVDDCHSPDQIIAEGKTAVFKDGEMLSAADGMDAVLEATGTIIPGGRHAVKVLTSQKHLILMNSEVDLIFGPYLSRLADQHQVVCTSCDGDQYGVLKHLIDDIEIWGFKLVMAGNMKGFLDRYANPTSIIPEADKRKLDYRACTSYTDGTKLNIEMSLISNALGLVTKVPGMYGPACKDIDDVPDFFDFETLWQERKPFVDYVLGAKPGGGIFAIGYCNDPFQRDMLKYYKMGNGPFYTFYRPYHLCHIEAMSSIMDAVTKEKTLLRPKSGFVTNVYAYAKKDLKKGDELDGIGGYTCYGLIENCSMQGISPGIPICLADQVFLKKDKKKDEKIFLNDVLFDPGRLDFKLFALASV
ncbi:MAG: homoserine dehydrogenase [Christensenellales bacterium]